MEQTSWQKNVELPDILFSREKETEILKEQIDKLNNAINREEEKAADLEVKAR
jgi:hypothetical protein